MLPREFDVVVNSNSIEHFDEPFDVLRANLARTRLLHLTLVPYREEPRAVHHLASFDEDSFPASLGGFERLFAQVIEVDTEFWPAGKQLLVAYGSEEYRAQRKAYEHSHAEREKWNAYYRDLPLIEPDPFTLAFNEEWTCLVRELLPNGGRVLEAGCGGGQQGLALAQAGYDVTMLDFSVEALDFARRSFSAAGAHAEFVQADAFSIGEPEFDLVFNAGVLEHYDLDEQVRFLRGMTSRSRRYVLVLIPNRACYWYWLWRVQKASKGDWPFGKEVPQTTLADAFETAGLKYLGSTFIGEAWTRFFIERLSGLDDDVRELILSVHRSALIPAASRGYLLAAVGTVESGSNAAAFPSVEVPISSQDIRNNEAWCAVLADALAGKLAADQERAHWQRRCEELEAASARDTVPASSITEAPHQTNSRPSEEMVATSEQAARRLELLADRLTVNPTRSDADLEISAGKEATIRPLRDRSQHEVAAHPGRSKGNVVQVPGKDGKTHSAEWLRRLYLAVPMSPERRHAVAVAAKRVLGRSHDDRREDRQERVEESIAGAAIAPRVFPRPSIAAPLAAYALEPDLDHTIESSAPVVVADRWMPPKQLNRLRPALLLYDGETLVLPSINWTNELSLRLQFVGESSGAERTIGTIVISVEDGSRTWPLVQHAVAANEPGREPMQVTLSVPGFAGQRLRPVLHFRAESVTESASAKLWLLQLVAGPFHELDLLAARTFRQLRIELERQHFAHAYEHPMYVERRKRAKLGIDALIPSERSRQIPGAVNNAFDYAHALLCERLVCKAPDFAARLRDLATSKGRLRVLSVGTGMGLVEAALFGAVACPVDLSMIDVNEELLRRAAAAMPVNVQGRPIVGDFNEVAALGSRFDIAMCVSGIHHMVELEHVFRMIRDALADDGELWLIGEQIGLNGNRLDASALAVANGIFEALPQSFRRNAWTGTSDERLPNRDCSEATFEGIRSEVIEAEVARFFASRHVSRRNCFLWRLVGPDYVANYSLDDAHHVALLEQFVDKEIEYQRSGGRPTELHGIYAPIR